MTEEDQMEMTMCPWSQGKALVWDATVWDTMADSHIVGSVAAPGHAAAEAETSKHRHHSFLEGQYLFVPLAFETFGTWGHEAKGLISEIGRRITNHTGEKRATEFLRQRISIEISRGNAFSVINTHPHTRGLEEIFSVLTLKR